MVWVILVSSQEVLSLTSMVYFHPASGKRKYCHQLRTWRWGRGTCWYEPWSLPQAPPLPQGKVDGQQAPLLQEVWPRCPRGTLPAHVLMTSAALKCQKPEWLFSSQPPGAASVSSGGIDRFLAALGDQILGAIHSPTVDLRKTSRFLLKQARELWKFKIY